MLIREPKISLHALIGSHNPEIMSNGKNWDTMDNHLGGY